MQSLFRQFTAGETVHLTGDNHQDYLRWTLGADLARLWLVRREQGILSDVLPTADHRVAAAPRARL